MEKEFGKYDRDDLREIVSFSGWLLSALPEMASTLAGKLLDDMPSDFSWLQLYDRTYIDLVAIVIKLFNAEELIADFVSSRDPQKAVIEWSRVDGSALEVEQELRPFALASIQALLRTCVSIAYYGYPLNAYRAAYLRAPSDDVLFKMVRIDKSVIALPELLRRSAIAEAEGDHEFFKDLARALTSAPHGRLKMYPGLRFCLVALQDDGGFEELSENLAYDLFCCDLKIYPDEGDAGRSLWQFIQRWKNNYPT